MRNVLMLILVLVMLAGCAAQRAFNEGRDLIDTGEVSRGLVKVEEAFRIDPQNREYRQYYFNQRDAAAQRFLALSEVARTQARWEDAERLYRQILEIDARNTRALSGLELLKTERRHQGLLSEAETLLKKGDAQGAHERVRSVLSENGANRTAQTLLRRVEEAGVRAATSGMRVAPSLNRPIDIEFQDVPVKAVFELVAKTTGINFLFDRDVRADMRTTLFVRNTSIDDVLRFVMVTNQLERKILNANTMLIYPSSAAKARDYQDMFVKSFYLANADVKQTANMIKALVKTKDLYIDERLNLLVIRDTPEAIRMAERLVANQDLADAEVVLEVEVLEVSSSALSDIGIQWPSQVSFSIAGAAGTAGFLTLPEWHERNAGMLRMSITNPLLLLNLKNQNSRSNLLANPRIRVKNREKAKVHIGDKVPVITTTTTATGFASESVNYLDVGLKLDVEPLITLDDEVGMKVGLEVSSLVREVRSNSGALTYQVGTRNAATTLKLKDGETQMLAGLISDEDRRTANKVPGLGNLPVLGKLFGSENKSLGKNEIVLLITPRIVRNLSRPDMRFEEFASGTEASIGAAPLRLESLSAANSNTGMAEPATTSPKPATSSAGKTNPQVELTGPGAVVPGQEFVVTVKLNSDLPVRTGTLEFSYDPSRLKFLKVQPGLLSNSAVFSATAQDRLGRLSLALSDSTDLLGRGDLVQLIFQASPGSSGAPTIRLESAALRNAEGKQVSSALPPPIAISMARQ